MRSLIVFIGLFTLLSTSCTMIKKKADILFINAAVLTGGETFDTADAMVTGDGRILATGSRQQLEETYEADTVVDLNGRYVFPGFIDAHCHFYGLAMSLQWVDLKGAESFDEVLRRMQEKADQQPEGWLIGRGWDQNLWPGKQFPDRARLDELFPGRPVALLRVDGHSLLANQAALTAAGFAPGHPYTSQEVEVRDGRMTGILSENAADHLRGIIPAPVGEELAGLLLQAQEICFRYGLTGVIDAGLDKSVIDFIDSLQQAGRLKIHISAMLNPNQENYDRFVINGPYTTDRLHVTAIKVYADGSLGSRTALMKKPYTDDPSRSGVLVTPPDSIRKVCALARKHGYQVCVHCIGDSAVKLVLDIYAEHLPGRNDLRWRIEHAQVCDPDDIPLFGKLSVIPSVQASHATSDMYWAEDRIGPERMRGAYAYQDLLKQNGWIPNGTDFPIEQVSPLLTFYAATARQDLQGIPDGGFQTDNALTREEALRSVTIWAAKANFDETFTGSLEPGKWADFVVLDRDIMSVPLPEIPSVRVLETWVHGESVQK